MKIQKIDRDALKTLRVAIDAALESVGKQYGVKLTASGKGHFGGATGDITVDIATIAQDGTVVTKEVSDFKKYHELFNLKPEHLGAKFTQGRDTFEIAGLSMNAKRFPILAKNVRTGKMYKFPESSISSLTGKKAASVRDLFGSAPVTEAPALPSERCENPMAMDWRNGDTSVHPCTKKATTSRKVGAKFSRLCADCAQLHDESVAEMKAEARCS
jgi:hypothetical protein